jgi:hypothetical protein
MVRRAGLERHRTFAAVRHARLPDHGLAKRLVDVERRAVEVVAGLEFAIHLFGKVMVAGVVIVFTTDHNDVVDNFSRSEMRRVRGMWHNDPAARYHSRPPRQKEI